MSFTESCRANSAQVIDLVENLVKIMYIAGNTSEETASGVRIAAKYEKYDVTGLKAMAKQKHLKVPAKSTQEDLIRMLEESDEEQALIEADENSRMTTGV